MKTQPRGRTTYAAPSPILARFGEPPALQASWASQSWTLRILRAFLGVTFVYAGLQKFLDANFLHSGTPDYIGSQLSAFAQGSPMAPVLHLLGHAPVLAGIGIALLEIAVGIGTLLGIAPITWAATGCGISVALFLSATWHVHPYFLGSDSIYAVAWAAYLLGLVDIARARPPVGANLGRRERAMAVEDLGRRQFLRAGVVAGGALLLGIGGSLFSGKPSSAFGVPAPSAVPTRSATKPPRKHHGGGSSEPPSSPTGDTGGGSGGAPAGTPIAKLDSVPVGGAVPFSDPTQGPAVLCRFSQTEVAAYSRVCTHAGCLVDFDSGSGVLYCPCHGAEFDPKHGARVIGGPAPAPLASIAVAIDPATGQVIATA